MERFLYRLGQSSYRDQLVLKGALMLTVWQVPVPRPTRDIDLLGRIDHAVPQVTAAIRQICTVPVQDDGLRFAPETVAGERIMEAADYPGVRVRFTAFLGKARIPMQVDVGFGDPVIPNTVAIQWPTLLDFPAPTLQGYSRESVVAEKVQIMVRLGEINSRMKDFFDIWLLAARTSFQGQILAGAIEATFRQRGTTIPASPVALSDAFGGDPKRQTWWEAFLRRYRLADRLGVPTRLPEVVGVIAGFLGPVLEALSDGRRFEERWPPGGPWISSEQV
jgi:hypothetical protein